jgi:hypothetical protein
MNVNTTTQFSATEPGNCNADWADTARLPRMTEMELTGSMAGHPDWNDVPSNRHEKAETAMPKRKLISVRREADIFVRANQGGIGSRRLLDRDGLGSTFWSQRSV